MDEVNESDFGEDAAQITPTGSRGSVGDDSSEVVSRDSKETHVNGIFSGSVMGQDKGLELPEPIRNMKSRNGLMSGMPSINLNELTVILRDPRMPSHKIMNEVADKIILKSEESESDDGFAGSASGGFGGMKGVLDCIFEVTYEQIIAANSDDEDDPTLEVINREIPCSVCNKVFESTMKWKTHVLVAHQDPSVLNIRRLSTSKEADRKDKNHTAQTKQTRGNSKSDVDMDNKSGRVSKMENKQAAEPSRGDENVTASKKHCSSSRSQPRGSSGEAPYSKHQGECILPTVGDSGAVSRKSGDLSCDIVIGTIKHTTVECADQSIVEDPTEMPETTPRVTGLVEREKMVESPTKGDFEFQKSEQIAQVDLSSQIVRDMKEKHFADSSIPHESLTNEIKLGVDAVSGRKRKATSPIPESTSPTSSLPTSPLNTKRFRKHVASESTSISKQKYNLE